MNRLYSVTVAAILALFAAAAIVSCTSTGMGQSPAESWVRASRAVHDTIGERFRGYVNADPTLDPDSRRTLLNAVGDWEFMIRQGESLYPPAVPAPAPAPVPATTTPAAGGGGR